MYKVVVQGKKQKLNFNPQPRYIVVLLPLSSFACYHHQLTANKQNFTLGIQLHFFPFQNPLSGSSNFTNSA